MQSGHAEHRHDLVADELLHGAAVALDDLCHLGEVARHDLAYGLRVEAVPEHRRLDHVGEENRDRLPELVHLETSVRYGHGFVQRWAPATRLYTAAIVFDTLSDKLQASLSGLGRGGRLDEESVSKAMREVRLALLEADVNFEVAKDFTAAVKERALGQDVLKSLSPGQQVVKIVHEELTALMGSGDSRLAFGRAPTVILLAGLQGSGKTTTAAKLALLLRKEGKRAALVACDLQRPAAIDQLEQLGRQIQIPVYRLDTQDAVAAARNGLDAARRDGLDVVILDTAGRLSIDEALMEELAAGAGRDEAHERPARARRDDRAGGGQRRTRVPGADRVRRGRAHQARRRRPRRRGALGQGGHGPAGEARLGGREARPARVLPSRSHGLADPRAWATCSR